MAQTSAPDVQPYRVGVHRNRTILSILFQILSSTEAFSNRLADLPSKR